MKTLVCQVLALGGLCALFAAAGNAAFAQGYDHADGNSNYAQSHQNNDRYDNGQNWQDSQYRQSDQYRHAGQTERRRLDRLHAAYAHAAAHGNYNAAERAHLHAQAIRARLRARHGDYRQHSDDNNQYQDNNRHRDDTQRSDDNQHGNDHRDNGNTN